MKIALSLLVLILSARRFDFAVNTTRSNARAFSFFTVVQFKNSGCQSTQALSPSSDASLRNGTCYSSTECTAKGGTAAGSCASGFGVCCVFLVWLSGASTSQNGTYFRNPGFPAGYAGSSAITYNVTKYCTNVCFLRLDFESFSTLGTAGTAEVNGPACARDIFIVTTNPSSGRVPTICGLNTGQHMYVDMSAANSSSVALTFFFAGTSFFRRWDIKATQVPCGSRYTPPPGCLQYMTGLTGRFMSFNFIPTNQAHLSHQRYSICIRQEAGFCCIQYTTCADPNSFSLNQGATPFSSGTDSYCTTDFITIAGSRGGICGKKAGNGGQLTSRYCGIVLNSQPKSTISQPICDCTQPFAVDVTTDNTNAGQSTIVVDSNRGFCLFYAQLPC